MVDKPTILKLKVKYDCVDETLLVYGVYKGDKQIGTLTLDKEPHQADNIKKADLTLTY